MKKEIWLIFGIIAILCLCWGCGSSSEGSTTTNNNSTADQNQTEEESAYTFEKAVACESIQNGTPVNIKSNFDKDAVPHFYANATDVTKNHKWKYKVMKEDSKIFEFEEENFREVEESWDLSYTTGYVENTVPGNYTVIFSIDIGEGFNKVGDVDFKVGNETYDYKDKRAVACEDIDNDNKPKNIRSYFSANTTPYFYASVKNIQKDHKWKYVVKKEKEVLFSYKDEDYKQVDGWWERTYTYGMVKNATTGEYSVDFYLDIGSGFNHIYTTSFIVGKRNKVHLIPGPSQYDKIKITNFASPGDYTIYTLAGKKETFSSSNREERKEVWRIDNSTEALAVETKGAGMHVTYIPQNKDPVVLDGKIKKGDSISSVFDTRYEFAHIVPAENNLVIQNWLNKEIEIEITLFNANKKLKTVNWQVSPKNTKKELFLDIGGDVGATAAQVESSLPVAAMMVPEEF